MSDLNSHMDAGAQRLLEESLERRTHTLDRRERVGNALFAAGFLVAALLVPVLADTDRAFEPLTALAFVIALAAVTRIELWGDAGYGVPSQIVFVPMLLLVSTPWVPLLVAAALVLSRAAGAWKGKAALGRSVLGMADAWFTLGPVIVLVAFEAELPDLANWPVYVLALAAQVVGDGFVAAAMLWVCQRVPPRAVVGDLLMVALSLIHI